MKWLILVLVAFYQPVFSQAIPVDSSYSVENVYQKEIKRFPQITPARPRATALVKEKREIIYSVIDDSTNGRRQLRMNIFYPAAKDQPRPAVALIHGGGWRSGNYTMPEPSAIEFAARGYVAATVEYRLTPEKGYPAALHDVKAAIRWLRAHHKEYNIDTSKIALMGFSSGGQLAALAAVTTDAYFEGFGGNARHSSAVQALVDVDGVIAFIHPDSQEGVMAAEWLGGTAAENPEIWDEASALTYAGKDSPPTLFIGSQFPRFLAGHKEMIHKLDKAGIYCEAHYFENTPHPFWLFHPWFEPTINHATKFLDKVFNLPLRD